MPLYYNTAAPDANSKNSITKTATDYGLRDFLLHKNIQNPIRYPQLSTSINGSPKGGEPFLDTMVGTGSIIQSVPIEIDGIFRYGNAIIMNKYINTDSTSPQLVEIENISTLPIFPQVPNGTVNYLQEDRSQFGLLAKSDYKQYRKLSTIKNLYLDTAKQIDMADLISLQPVQTEQQITSYLDEYGGLNLGGPSTQALDVIGSIFNGGLGLAKGGVVTNFDVRASIAGRVLGATGLINDTKLGIIGGQQLALSLANNAAFNAEQLLLGKLNVGDNILSLIKNGTFAGLRPDYKITVPTSGILDYSERILGFSIPKSYIGDSGSIFFSENGSIGNIERANNMIINTGKGQLTALISNINANLIGTSPNGYDSPDSGFSFFRSGYAPGYKNNKGEKAINPQGYVFMDNEGSILNFFSTGKRSCIPEISYNRPAMIEKYGFTDLGDGYHTSSIKQIKATWTSNNTAEPTVNLVADNEQIIGSKKTLLGKTQMLFNSVGMKTIVSTKGDMTIGNPDQLQTAVVKGGISKGSAVLSNKNFDINGNVTDVKYDAENTFCRSWTTFDRYDKVNKLIRHRGLNESDSGTIFPESNKWRQHTQGSVLDDNGFVKIAPYKDDDFSRNSTTPKKYMFSIENLAWVGTPAVNLLPCEQGPGDLLSNKFGKIMWFPPYDINFSETSSVSLESTSFIGRGEPIYTYNNTERTGQLSFKVIVDHPSIMNSFEGNDGPSDEFIASFFAGCTDLDSKWADKLTQDQKNNQEQKVIQEVPKVVINNVKKPDSFNIYFKNDNIDINEVYESGSAFHFANNILVAGIGEYPANTKYTKNNRQLIWPDNTDFSLNKKLISIGSKFYQGWIDGAYFTDLKDYLDNVCKTCKINVAGHASEQGYASSNVSLSLDRATAIQKFLIGKGIPKNKISIVKSQTGTINNLNVTYSETTPPDQIGPKSDRFAAVTFVNDFSQVDIPKQETIKTNDPQKIALTSEIKRKFYTECNFFEKLKEEDSFIYDKLKEKIKFFSPAFHSTTPEGFNSRLTFLLQCTRQGPTISNGNPKNLAFGAAPVCILRIGDFYNTKIMIDNLSFDYEPLVWDLNPEGIGVQPMIANVTMSFKYIGGSSLYGPINKLQNAISFNYFANTQVYDRRADYISGGSGTYILVPGDNPAKKPQTKIVVDEVTILAPLGTDKNQVLQSAHDTTQEIKVTGDTNVLNTLIIDSMTKTTSELEFRIANKSEVALTKQYNVKASIVAQDNSESYSVMMSSTYGQLYQFFTINFNDTTPKLIGLSDSKQYNLIIDLLDSGTKAITIRANIAK